MSTAGPYPYIYVNPDGTARELHANERVYLETPFKVGDGNTPYIKIDYDARDGWGEIRGYLGRSKLPQDIPIQPAPVEDPTGRWAVKNLPRGCAPGASRWWRIRTGR
ncbi:MAG: hypothetical protein WA851_01370 [Xanthobacteraceae bacterium]